MIDLGIVSLLRLGFHRPRRLLSTSEVVFPFRKERKKKLVEKFVNMFNMFILKFVKMFNMFIVYS